jgi:glycosidase
MQGNLHGYLQEMDREVLSKYNVMSVAEGAGNTLEDAHNLVDADRHELNMAYPFDGVDVAQPAGYSLLHFKEVFTRWDEAFAEKGWLSVFLSNHDQARLVSRFGNDKSEFREPSAKMLATFVLTNKTINEAIQEKDPNSCFNYFRRLTDLRKDNLVLVYGKYALLDKDNAQVYAYTREWHGNKVLIMLNFSDKPAQTNALTNTLRVTILLNNYKELPAITAAGTALKPYQAVVYKITAISPPVKAQPRPPSSTTGR